MVKRPSICLLLLFIMLTIKSSNCSVVRNKRQEELGAADAPKRRLPLFEGDIAGISPDTIEDLVKQSNAKNLVFNPGAQSAATNNIFQHWPNGIVHYIIAPVFTPAEIMVIQQAFDDFHKLTCIRFVPRTNQPDYISIKRVQGCFSPVGRSGGEQDVSLDEGCVVKGIVIHELMHSIGFFHEQSRWDRDNYIEIQMQNVMDFQDKNFQRYELDRLRDLHTPYDYGSVMHYSMFEFSSNGQPTVIPKPNPNIPIGQRNGFSEIDLKEINILYQCGAITPPPVPGMADEPMGQTIPQKIDLSQRGVRLWSHFTQYKVENPFECIEKCKDLPQCFACSHDTNNTVSIGNCFLMHENFTATYDPTFVWSAWNREEIEMGVRLFNHYMALAVTNSIACKRVCQHDTECIAMTFNSGRLNVAGINCYLYHKGYGVQTDPTMQWSMWRKS